MTVMDTIVIRVDGGKNIGLGHIYRMIALADMIRGKFEVYFVISEADQSVQEIVQKSNYSILPLAKTISITDEIRQLVFNVLNKLKPKLIILDGYNFKEEYQIALKNKGFKLISVDGIYNSHFYSDAVLNYNLYADKNFYQKEKYTKLFLGSSYAPLRKPFLKAAKTRAEPQITDKNLTIIFGGSDLLNLLIKILELITENKQINDFNKVNIVLGKCYQHIDSLNGYIVDHSLHNTNILENLDAIEMVETYRNSEIIISPAGYSLYEIFCIGVPIITGYYADNQKLNADCIGRFDLGISIGDFRLLSANMLSQTIVNLRSKRNDYVNNQHHQIDGNQKDRIIKLVEYIIN
jgi:UDP-2,4-diacetamido-2,4,6-trideoxy-beta-L-altropyranose hydrolase